jgi:hypothetical protein
MIARKEHGRNLAIAVGGGARVARVVEEPAGKALAFGGLLVPEHAFDMPRDRVNEHHRRKLAAGDRRPPHRDLLVDQPLAHALVQPLVAPHRRMRRS